MTRCQFHMPWVAACCATCTRVRGNGGAICTMPLWFAPGEHHRIPASCDGVSLQSMPEKDGFSPSRWGILQAGPSPRRGSIQPICPRRSERWQAPFSFLYHVREHHVFEADVRPGVVGVPVGAFADPQFPKPSVSVWEESMHHWLVMPEEIEHAQQRRSTLN